MNRNESLYLLDAHSLIFQVYHAIPEMTGPKGQPTNAVYGFAGDLLRLRRKEPDYLVCVFDAPGKTFRDAIYEEYKAERPPIPEDLAAQLPVIRRVVDAMRIASLEIPGYEADDTIATVARKAENRGIDVFICSGDKDLRQLLSDRIRIYNLRKDQVIDVDTLVAEWGIRPDQVIDFLALVGDKVDNVPGVPGIGVKTAARLLQEHGSIEGILSALDQIRSARIRKNLEDHRDTLQMSRSLVRLACDVPVTWDWDNWRLKPWDTEALLEVF